jgi:hypothetical protein
MADPKFYGVNAIHLPEGWILANQTDTPVAGSQFYLAISSTNLQGVYYSPEVRNDYALIRNLNPIDVLGDSIFIYAMPPDPKTRRK